MDIMDYEEQDGSDLNIEESLEIQDNFSENEKNKILKIIKNLLLKILTMKSKKVFIIKW